MPTAAAIRAQMKESGVRAVGTPDMARRFADLLAEDEQVVDMVKVFVLERDAKTIAPGASLILLALTDRRLVLGARGLHGQMIGDYTFIAMPFDELSNLTALSGGRFEWLCIAEKPNSQLKP
jgi:hypothetical protein